MFVVHEILSLTNEKNFFLNILTFVLIALEVPANIKRVDTMKILRGKYMNIFKEVIYIVNSTIVTFGFGCGVAQLLSKDYQIASWVLFGVSILFIVGYFTERCSQIKE